MTPQQLKNSILQLAIQGKLVPQDPSDEPASILIDRIREEKARLVREKKIKKDKNSSFIYRGSDKSFYEVRNGAAPVPIDDQLPFDIPDSWTWAKLGEIGAWAAGATPNRNNEQFYKDGDIPWLKTGDLNDSYIDKVSENITRKALEETSVKLIPPGSVLIAMYGATIGKLGIANIELTTNQACCACVPFSGVLNTYLFFFLRSIRKEVREMGAGGAQPNISKEKIVDILIPLPPTREQARISKQLKKHALLINKYSNAWCALQDLGKKFIGNLRKSLLQEAIQGKLVPQLPEDGTAQDLLVQIRAEKERLVREGKLKPSALTVPSIERRGNSYYENGRCIDDELPFDIPDSWSWVRLEEICMLHGSKNCQISEKEVANKGKYPVVSQSDAYIIGYSDEENKVFHHENPVIVFGDHTALVKYIDFDFIIGADGTKIIAPLVVSCQFLYRALQFILIKVSKIKGYTRHYKYVKNAYIPLPPAAEQQRIVVTLEKILTLTNQ